METEFEGKATDRNASLHFTTTRKGTIWLDQVSLMPMDTHKGHGFRHDLIQLIADLKPKFLRFPGILYECLSSFRLLDMIYFFFLNK